MWVGHTISSFSKSLDCIEEKVQNFCIAGVSASQRPDVETMVLQKKVQAQFEEDWKSILPSDRLVLY